VTEIRYPVVLFDLDGTLIDSGPILLNAFRYATNTVLGREIPDGELMANVGGYGLLEQMRAFDGDRAEELVRVYTAYQEPLYDELALFPGIVPMLDKLKSEGRRLGVVTTKRRPAVELSFSIQPIGHYFDVVISSEDSERPKPYPDPILLALERLGSPRSDAAYVGDAPFDIAAAKAAGVFAVGVTWGGIHPDERLEAAEPDVLVSDTEELLAVL
jgi:pyrophosphatase PpaX